MAYRPLQVDQRPQSNSIVSTMSNKGLNLRTAPQFLNPEYALIIQNYLIEDEGKLVKRGGLTKMLEVAGNNAITMLEPWTDDILIFGYSTTVARYQISTDTVTTIKNDFSANSGFDGTKYGEYFFVCNGVEKIYRIDLSTFTATEVANAPICSVLEAIGPRLYAGNLSTDSTAVKYSEVDDGSNPPFDAWSSGTLATQGGTVNYRNAGTVRSVVPLGQTIVVFSDKGFFAFSLDTIDSGGSLTKVENVQKYVEDFGGGRGAISTDKGIYYVNEGGLYHMVSSGQTDVPLSKQEVNVSELLGRDYFENIGLSNTDIMYDRRKRIILVTGANSSSSNNWVLCYNLDFKAFSTFGNWNISRFVNMDGTIYGASAVSTKVYKCFDGYSDDGLAIGTEYYQELPMGDLQTRNFLKGAYVHGLLSPSTTLTVRFDIFDRNEKLTTDKLRYSWTPQNNNNGFDGYNSAQYSSSAYGGDSDIAGLVQDFNGCRPFIRNFHRLRVRITGGDKLPHQLTFIRLEGDIKQPIRVRKLTKLT